MNIKAMRNVHLYLGCFFAPLLIFFLVSGCWQVFDLHHASKSPGGYKPFKVVKSLSSIHMDQTWKDKKEGGRSSEPFKYLIILMSLGLFITTLLGIVMAFKYVDPWIVWFCLFLGVLVPWFLIWIGSG